MSRLLAELLGAGEPGFSLGLRKLEKAAGAPAVDVHLTAELCGAHKRKVSQLGLDSNDTNGQELYHALNHLIGNHDKLLTSALHSQNGAEGNSILVQIQSTVEKLSLPKSCWSLKPTSAKRLLKAMPPKTVMKLLGYRSIDSMLKREPVGELMAGLAIIESAKWQSRFQAKYQSLTSSDFETRNIDVLILDPKKWGNALTRYAAHSRTSVLCVREMGIVMILPPPAAVKKGVSITLLPQIIDAMYDIKLFSMYAKLKQVNANFGSLIMTASAGIYDTVAEVHGHVLNWPMLHNYFGTSRTERSMNFFEPHASIDDFIWPHVSRVVASLHGGLDFWRDTAHLGASFADGTVSYNVLDVSFNYCNNIPYHKRVVYYLRRDLWHELYARYLSHEQVEKNILNQLELA